MASRFSISAVFKGIDKISKPISKMGNSVSKFVRQSNRKIVRLGKSFKKLGAFMGKAIIGGAALAGAAVGAAVLKTAELGDEAAKTARRLGITAESLQELRFAADRQGVSAGVLNSSFTALQKRIGELKSGTGSLFGFLKKTGDKAFIRQLSLAKDTGEAFEMMTKKMGTIKDPLKRAAFASAAFSRAGVDMLSFMEAGQDGISKLRMEARKYGAVISDEAAEQSEVFIDSLTNLKSSLGGIGKTFSSKLIPTISNAMQKFADFWALNKDIIGVGMDKFLNFVGDTFRAIRPAVTDLFNSLKKLFGAFFEAVSSLLPEFTAESDDLSDSITGMSKGLKFLADIGTKAFEFITMISPFLKPFLATLLIYKGILIAIAVVTKGWAIAQGILNAILLLNPIGLIVLGIAALIAIIVLLVQNWDTVVMAFQTGVAKIWEFLSGLLDNPFIAAAGVIFAPFLAIPALIVKHWEPIKEFFSNLWDGLANGFSQAMAIITNIIKTVDAFFEKIVGGIIGTIGDIAGKFGIDLGTKSADEKGAETPQVVSPSERVLRSIEERTSESKSTLTIKDETGRAELAEGKKNGGVKLKLATSGAF
jgi:hypothetical protein